MKKDFFRYYYTGVKYDQYFIMVEMERCENLRKEGQMSEKEYVLRKVELILLEIKRETGS